MGTHSLSVLVWCADARLLPPTLQSIAQFERVPLQLVVLDWSGSVTSESLPEGATIVSAVGSSWRRIERELSGSTVLCIEAGALLLEPHFDALREAATDRELLLCGWQYGVDRQVFAVKGGERCVEDLLRYWIPHMVPPLGSWFVSRELLARCEVEFGDSLAAVAYETLLSVCKNANCALSCPEPLVLVPGEHLNGRSYGRVFARWARAATRSERRISYVVPLLQTGEILERTIAGIANQVLLDSETVLVLAPGEKLTLRALQRSVAELARRIPKASLRTVVGTHSTVAGMLDEGMRAAAGEILVPLLPGMIPSPTCSLQISNSFMNDAIGALLPVGSASEIAQAVMIREERGVTLNISGLLSAPIAPLGFAVRALVARYMGGFEFSALPHLAIIDFLLRIAATGWLVQPDEHITIEQLEGASAAACNTPEALRPLIAAQVIESLATSLDDDPLASLRLASGFSVRVPDPLVENAQELLSRGPLRWFELSVATPVAELEQVVRDFPEFSAGWQLLERAYARRGEDGKARKARAKLEALLAG